MPSSSSSTPPSDTPVPFAQILGGGGLLATVSRALTTHTDSQLAPIGVTSQQAAVLMLTGKEGATPAALRPLIGTDTAGMTRLVDRLCRKGLLERRDHPTDRRSITVHLTAQGEEVTAQIPPVLGTVTTRAMAGLTQTQIKALREALTVVVNNLNSLDT